MQETEFKGGIGDCWSCRGPIDRSALFCHICGAVQPPSDLDYFTRFGLRPTFDIDISKLEKLYLNLQRHLHPDRFVTKSAKERLVAQSQIVHLNDAYETLNDPLNRSVYLMGLKGYKSAAEGEKTIQDPELLMEMMEQREKLAEASHVDEIEELAAGAGAKAISLLPELSKAFAREDLKTADLLTVHLKYLRKFLEETRERLAVMAVA